MDREKKIISKNNSVTQLLFNSNLKLLVAQSEATWPSLNSDGSSTTLAISLDKETTVCFL